MARGQPKRPAPVSGPGAQSRRTDGGAGSKTQPLRTPTGGDYGEAGKLEEQQRSAPLAVAGGAPVPSQASSAPPAPGGGGVFGPSERPGEDPNTGMMTRGQAVAEDVDGYLRVLYSQFPHPAIAALIRKDT